jgi:glycosyltransferase involved in cell wall biosynthesis
MKATYLAPADIQVARVERHLMIQFCAALNRIGVETELVAIRIRTMPGEANEADPLALYEVQERFPVRLVRVPVKQTSRGAWVALNRLAAHTIEATKAALDNTASEQMHVFLARNYSTGLMLLAIRRLAATRPLILFEVHAPPKNAFQRFILKRTDRVVANSFALGTELLKRDDVVEERLLATHQGVDLDLIEQRRLSKAEARMRLGLPPDKKLVVYTGKIYVGYREVEHLLEAAKLLEDHPDILFVLVGGRNDHVSRFRERINTEQRTNVQFMGFVPPRAVHDYQFAADVLVLYYPSGIDLNRYRSPGKLFEYMAAGRPIVCVDLPVLREVLGTDPAAVMVPPDAPDRLAQEIANLIDDPERADRLSKTALRRVQAFTWTQRARTVAEFIRHGNRDGRI